MTAETSNARGEWVLVPRELTQGMRSALARAVNASCNTDEWYAHTLAAAPQPPAEAQPVAKLVNRKDADGGKTTTFIRPTEFGMDLPPGEYPLHLHPPPSAPVGVEAIAAEIRASLGRGATVCTRRRWAIELEALAQQTAAVDEGFVSRLAEALTDQDWDVDPDGDGSGIAQLRAAVVAAQRQEPTT